MIKTVLLMDSVTRVVVGLLDIDTDKPMGLSPGLEIAPRDDGEVGWTLLPNGEWYNPKPQRRYTKEEGVRNRRAFKLKKSDKYALPDYPITAEKRQEWLAYRQALRDITNQPGFPDNVVWPVEPT